MVAIWLMFHEDCMSWAYDPSIMLMSSMSLPWLVTHVLLYHELIWLTHFNKCTCAALICIMMSSTAKAYIYFLKMLW